MHSDRSSVSCSSRRSYSGPGSTYRGLAPGQVDADAAGAVVRVDLEEAAAAAVALHRRADAGRPDPVHHRCEGASGPGWQSLPHRAQRADRTVGPVDGFAAVEPHEDLVEQCRRGDARAHAVAQVDEHGGVVADLVEQTAELIVERPVHRFDGVADRPRDTGVVVGPVAIVHPPALVPDAVGLAEGHEEEVPRLAAEHVDRHVGLAPRPFGQLVAKGGDLAARARRDEIAELAAQRFVVDLGGEFGRPGDRVQALGHDRVVAAPIVDLDAVEAVDDVHVRGVDECHPPAGVAEAPPEGGWP